MGIYDWSKTAGSNTTLEAISWAEGMAPSSVNNGVRAIAAALKSWQEDMGGALATTGSANTYVLTPNTNPAALADGMLFAFVCNVTNTGASTLNVNSLGAKALRKVTDTSTNDVAIEANDLRVNGVYLVAYDASANAAAGAWILLNPATFITPATQAQAEAGTDNTTRMSPLRTKQAIDVNVAAAINATTVNVPSHLSTLVTAPPSIKENGAEWEIFAFANGATQKTTAEATADYKAALEAALKSGELVTFPRWNYPIRGGRITLTNQDAPISWRGSGKYSKLYVGTGMTVASVGQGAIFSVTPTSEVSLDNIITVTFRDLWFDANDITAAQGVGPNPGLSWFDLFKSKVRFENCVFDSGYTTPAGSEIGRGYMDQLIGTHACYQEEYLSCFFLGAVDSGIYLSGTLTTETLGTNPISTTSGSATVTIALASANTKLTAGDAIAISTAPSVGGIVVSGGYTVQTVGASSFTITHSSNATSTATGGSTGIVLTKPQSNPLSLMTGSGALVDNCRFWRCNNGISTKRQHIDLTVRNTRMVECVNGINAGNVGTPENFATHGKRVTVEDFKTNRMQGYSINLEGSRGVFLRDIEIRDFGGYVSDSGTTSAGTIYAVDLSSCYDWAIDNFEASQTGSYANLTAAGALRVNTSTDYPFGSTDGHATRCRSIGCKVVLTEGGTGTDRNVFEFDRVVNNTTAVSIGGSSSIYLGPRMKFSRTIDHPAIANAARLQFAIPSGAGTATGVALGDIVEFWSASNSLEGLDSTVLITATNTIEWHLENNTGASVNLGNITYTVYVRDAT